ncbi:MAG: DUF4093 domain-containing protein [Oscillospiraceae bacterium]|nr:DUF4093 domain-containing protein [Oscillospiraceae bacterium]
MLKLRQALVVEGKYDKNTLSQIVDAPIFVTNGFGIFKDRDMMALLRTVAKQRGLIVLTDADGAGLVIRNRIKSAIAPQYLLHAYIPDVYGKEKRKAAPGKEGKLGVEGMDPETLLRALRNAGAEFLDTDSEADRAQQPITKTDLYELGLSGRPDSRAKQLALKQQLGLPEHLSANALLTALNCICTRQGLEVLLWHPESSTSPSPTK